MQVQELKNEGLSREYSVTISVSDIDARIDARLGEIGGDVRIPGFRPGKAPIQVLRQRYGKAVMGEVLEKTVTETSQEVLDERELRPAVQPKIEIQSFEEGKDLVYTIGVDLMPDIKPMDFSSLSLTRLKAQAGDDEIEEALERMAKDFPQQHADPGRPRRGKRRSCGDRFRRQARRRGLRRRLGGRASPGTRFPAVSSRVSRIRSSAPRKATISRSR